jgi:hypothetical protein
MPTRGRLGEDQRPASCPGGELVRGQRLASVPPVSESRFRGTWVSRMRGEEHGVLVPRTGRQK